MKSPFHKIISISSLFVMLLLLTTEPAMAQGLGRSVSGSSSGTGIGSAASRIWCGFTGGCASGSTPGLANPVTGDLGSNPDEATSGATFLTYFVSLWRATVTIGAILVIIFFLWGAIEWISAGGDAGKIQKARDKITQAIIGLIVLVGSFVIINLVSNLFFGEAFQILNPVIPRAPV